MLAALELDDDVNDEDDGDGDIWQLGLLPIGRQRADIHAVILDQSRPNGQANCLEDACLYLNCYYVAKIIAITSTSATRS